MSQGTLTYQEIYTFQNKNSNYFNYHSCVTDYLAYLIQQIQKHSLSSNKEQRNKSLVLMISNSICWKAFR